MAIIRQSPWFTLNQLQEEMNRLFERAVTPEAEGGSGSVATAEWIPAVDIREEQHRFVLLADIPAVDPKDIDITMEKGVLTIRGDRRAEESEESDAFKRIERPRGVFHRRFVLPDTADAEHISARGTNGVLEITIPKYERIQPRRILVEG
ncbi:HSP20 family protein [Gammaproteobacteria bacterium]